MRCVCPTDQANRTNFNLAVGYQEPGSHRSMNFWASSVLSQPASVKDNTNMPGLLHMEKLTKITLRPMCLCDT